MGSGGRDEMQIDAEKQVDPSSVPLERRVCLHDAGERPYEEAYVIKRHHGLHSRIVHIIDMHMSLNQRNRRK
jgi:hypothetical protein